MFNPVINIFFKKKIFIYNNWKPVFLDFFVLYYNEPLLNKYNQKVPKTWNELYDTGKYIMEKENNNNNNNNINLIIYNGFFPGMVNFKTLNFYFLLIFIFFNFFYFL